MAEDRETQPVRRFEVPKPVSVGDVVDVTIESQGGHGDGIAKIEGFVVFVKGGSKGESCKVRITEVKRTFAIGEKTTGASQAESEMEDEVEGSRSGPSG